MGQKILFLGDLFYDYPEIHKDIHEIGQWIRDNDYRTVLNLEGGLLRTGSEPIQKRGAHLAASAAVIPVLKELNTMGVCLSNNHMLDFGQKSLETTLYALDQAGILHTGAGSCLEDAVQPMIFSVDGQEIRIWNYGWDVEETVYAGRSVPGCAPRDPNIIFSPLGFTNSLRDAGAESDGREDRNKDHVKNVLFMHWGFEYNRLPMPYDIHLAHQMADSGADLIIGSHPHLIQPREVYHGTEIYYSLGNFYFGSRRKRFNRKFREQIENQSDYGLGVIWEPASGKTEQMILSYDHSLDWSEWKVPGQMIGNLLEDISDTDYLSRAYRKKTLKRKKNINPVLMPDERYNRIQLDRLANRRKIRRFIKKLLRK